LAKHDVECDDTLRHAGLASEAVAFNIDTWATKDKLYARLEPLEDRVDGRFDSLEVKLLG